MPTPNIVPRSNNEGSLGHSDRRWAVGHFETLFRSGLPVYTQADNASEAEITDGVVDDKVVVPSELKPVLDTIAGQAAPIALTIQATDHDAGTGAPSTPALGAFWRIIAPGSFDGKVWEVGDYALYNGVDFVHIPVNPLSVILGIYPPEDQAAVSSLPEDTVGELAKKKPIWGFGGASNGDVIDGTYNRKIISVSSGGIVTLSASGWAAGDEFILRTNNGSNVNILADTGVWLNGVSESGASTGTSPSEGLHFYCTSPSSWFYFVLTTRRLSLSDATKLALLQDFPNTLLDATDVLDEDDFASDSASKPPSQQSVAAYIDSRPGLVPEKITISNAQGFHSGANGVYLKGDDINSLPAYYMGDYVIANLYGPGRDYALYWHENVIADADQEIWQLGIAGTGPVTPGLVADPYPDVQGDGVGDVRQADLAYYYRKYQVDALLTQVDVDAADLMASIEINAGILRGLLMTDLDAVGRNELVWLGGTRWGFDESVMDTRAQGQEASGLWGLTLNSVPGTESDEVVDVATGGVIKDWNASPLSHVTGEQLIFADPQTRQLSHTPKPYLIGRTVPSGTVLNGLDLHVNRRYHKPYRIQVYGPSEDVDFLSPAMTVTIPVGRIVSEIRACFNTPASGGFAVDVSVYVDGVLMSNPPLSIADGETDASSDVLDSTHIPAGSRVAIHVVGVDQGTKAKGLWVDIMGFDFFEG